MEKSVIKTKLREALAMPEQMPVKEEQVGVAKHKADYGEIQRKLDGTLLKASNVMAAAGLGDEDDAGDRSYFSKKLNQKRNEKGGLYQFSPNEIARLIKIINNPSAYLSSKS